MGAVETADVVAFRVDHPRRLAVPKCGRRETYASSRDLALMRQKLRGAGEGTFDPGEGLPRRGVIGQS